MNPESSEETGIEPIRTPLKKRSFYKKIFSEGWHYFFQFFMLFLAVTAGFFAENLREEYSARKQSRDYASSMVNELVMDSMNVKFQIKILASAVGRIDALANHTRDKQIGQLNNFDLYKATLIVPNPAFRWSRATLEQIKGSGILGAFSDSIVYCISHYDALTLHLDQDNMEDRQLYGHASELKSRVIDMNYPEELKKSLTSGHDSLFQNSTKDFRPLLTTDLSDVKSMVNAYLIAKENSVGRISELSFLMEDQARLIRLLKREYNLK